MQRGKNYTAYVKRFSIVFAIEAISMIETHKTCQAPAAIFV